MNNGNTLQPSRNNYLFCSYRYVWRVQSAICELPTDPYIKRGVQWFIRYGAHGESDTEPNNTFLFYDVLGGMCNEQKGSIFPRIEGEKWRPGSFLLVLETALRVCPQNRRITGKSFHMPNRQESNRKSPVLFPGETLRKSYNFCVDFLQDGWNIVPRN